MTSRFNSPSHCPVCGAEVPPKARACPECGADERAGWDEDAARYDELDLPDDAFEDSASEENSGRKRKTTVNGVPLFWWAVGLVILGLIVCLVFKSGL